MKISTSHWVKNRAIEIDRAREIAAQPGEGELPHGYWLTLRSGVSAMNDNIVGWFHDNRTAFNVAELLMAMDRMQSPEYSSYDVAKGSSPPHVADALDGDERAELERLRALVNTPELHSFTDGVVLEAAHQRERWGNDHDAGKEPQDWFWLLGYLAGKALKAHSDGNAEKALHHTISSAAALANWHGAILGTHNMRPGIDGEAAIAARAEAGVKK
jgi:hypothetical protein